MPKETHAIYKLSDIVGILIPCPACEKETPFPLDYNPDAGDGRIRGFMCPHCLSFELGAACQSFASAVSKFRQVAGQVPQLNDIRIEFKDDPT